MTKTSCNIRNRKSDLRLHNFREVYLGNKQISDSNKLALQWKKMPKMSGVLRGSYYENCPNVPPKKHL